MFGLPEKKKQRREKNDSLNIHYTVLSQPFACRTLRSARKPHAPRDLFLSERGVFVRRGRCSKHSHSYDGFWYGAHMVILSLFVVRLHIIENTRGTRYNALTS